jgi:glycosyltransferase involved in cell wall biosynthesis
VRVLHVAPSIARSYGGPTRSLAGYAAAAVAEGGSVTIAAPSAPAADAAEFEGVVGQGQLHLFPAVGRNAFTFSGSLLRWVWSHAASFDVIHIHGLFNPVSSLSCSAALHAGRPVVIRPFGTLSRYTYTHRRKALKRVWLASIETANVKRAAALHFTTDEERDEAAWHGADIAPRAYVVPPPWMPLSAGETGIQRTERSNTVAFIGRLDPIKNLEALIDAWPRVTASIPDAELVLAGAGDASYTRTLRERARERNARVTFPGFLDEKVRARLLASSGAFVLPSHHENFGIAALEAIAAGAPAIISPHVQLRSFIEQRALGKVCTTDDAPFAAAIIGVLQDQPLRQRVREVGYDLVVETYGIAAIGPRLTSMYLDAVDRHRLTSHRL